MQYCFVGKISWFASQPRKPRNFYPPKNTRYTVYVALKYMYLMDVYKPEISEYAITVRGAYYIFSF